MARPCVEAVPRDTFQGAVRAVRRRYATSVLLACPAQDVACEVSLLEGVKVFKAQYPSTECIFTLIRVSNVDELLLHILRLAPTIVVTIGTTLLRTAIGGASVWMKQRSEDVHGQLLHSAAKHLVFPLLDTASQRRLSGGDVASERDAPTPIFLEDVRRLFAMISAGDRFGTSGGA